MLFSMTGFGEARQDNDGLSISIEVRAVNNRHLKINVRGSDPYPLLEADFEKKIRQKIHRGTIHVHIHCDRAVQTSSHRIDGPALKSYLQQILEVCEGLGLRNMAPQLIGPLLALPGVTDEKHAAGRPSDTEWKLVEAVLESALEQLNQMRRDEGKAMADELLLLGQGISDQITQIREHTPRVVENYRTRIRTRIAESLAELNVSLTEDHLIREIAIFAERSDVSEEMTRLESHLVQFREIIHEETDSPGRKLEFLTQEMLREANTTGSKAGDVAISRHVVEIKAALDKIRELVQNVE